MAYCYSLFKNCSFDSNKNKHKNDNKDCKKHKDCMKTFVKTKIAHNRNSLLWKKKEILRLTKKEK